MVMTTKLFKYAALQQLNDSVDDRQLAIRLFRPVLEPIGWINQMPRYIESRDAGSIYGIYHPNSDNASRERNVTEKSDKVVLTEISLLEGGCGVCRVGVALKSTLIMIYQLTKDRDSLSTAAPADDSELAAEGSSYVSTRSRVSTAASTTRATSASGSSKRENGKGSHRPTGLLKKKASLLSIQEADLEEDDEGGSELNGEIGSGRPVSGMRGSVKSSYGARVGTGISPSRQQSRQQSRAGTGARGPPSSRQQSSLNHSKEGNPPIQESSTSSATATSASACPILLAGGVFAPERVLCALGAVDKIFLIGWILPPFFPGSTDRVPSIPGLKISTICGIALGSALRWSNPSIHKIRAKEQEKSEEHGRHAADDSMRRRRQWRAFSENSTSGSHTQQRKQNSSKKPASQHQSSGGLTAAGNSEKVNSENIEEHDHDENGGAFANGKKGPCK
jgi:hypothetical protein